MNSASIIKEMLKQVQHDVRETIRYSINRYSVTQLM